MASEMIANRYMLVKKVGEGGMASVYLAIDTILKREVAIKVLKTELTTDDVALMRFKREANAIASTSHPNIVEIYDVGQDVDKHFIVMEYVHGKTLKQLVRQRGVIVIEEAVNIMKQLVSAVSHAHKTGIIHRDIKAQNVLVKDDGTVKLSDFGIAIMADSKQQLTQAQTVVGSVHYMAPELAGGESASAQSDIYALGIVFYEMLTGDVPYHGETAVEIALKHMHNDVPSIIKFNPNIPQAVENIVIRASARKKELRYESAEKMYNDLVTCLDITRNFEEKLILNINEKKENKTTTKTTTKKRKQKRYKQTVPIILASCLAVALLFILLALNGQLFKGNKVLVPDIYLWDIGEAQQKLVSCELTIESISYQATDDIDKGKVLEIKPSVGSEVPKGSTVTLVVSLGKNYTIGNYIGCHFEDVKKELESVGFKVSYNYVEPNGFEYGQIVNQSILPNTVVAPDEQRSMMFDIADHISFVIPKIEGYNIENAKDSLEALGAKVIFMKLPIEDNINENGEYKVPLNTVVSTQPAINTYYIQTDEAVLIIYHY